jgi:hypothetical protein
MILHCLQSNDDLNKLSPTDTCLLYIDNTRLVWIPTTFVQDTSLSDEYIDHIYILVHK